MNVICPNCRATNSIPDYETGYDFLCYNCGVLLPKVEPRRNDTAEAVGLIGGAVLGGSIAGPPGAIIGALLGVILGRGSKTTE
jgi:hypothetical protein